MKSRMQLPSASGNRFRIRRPCALPGGRLDRDLQEVRAPTVAANARFGIGARDVEIAQRDVLMPCRVAVSCSMISAISLEEPRRQRSRRGALGNRPVRIAVDRGRSTRR